jgi:hypothetical protein
MKKLLFIALLFIGSISNAQEISKSFEDILKPYLERTLEGIEKGVEYASEEIPIVLEQYVMYEAITSWIYVIFGVLLIVVFSTYLNKTWKNKNSWFYEKSTYNEPDKFAGTMFTGLGGALTLGCSLGLILKNIGTAIMATWFPKLFLVKEFINLV